MRYNIQLACVSLTILCLLYDLPRSTIGFQPPIWQRDKATQLKIRTEPNLEAPLELENNRRRLISAAFVGPSLIVLSDEATAAPFGFGRVDRQSVYVLPSGGKNMTGSQRYGLPSDDLTVESCLLRLLPVKKEFFRSLQSSVEGLSVEDIQDSENWKKTCKKIESIVERIDKNRGKLQPVFNPDDDTLLQIAKGERGEQLIESLRSTLVEILLASRAYNATKVTTLRRKALLGLSDIGELLVPSYPFEVPSEGKFSYLPRLLGRAKVTFTFRRQKQVLGNVTIIADGYAAPITAGNFLDLSLRNFYTGLPIKYSKKRLGTGSDFEVANIPILGSFQEGFYDPLTAELRRLPLEIVRYEKGTGVRELSYSQGLSSLDGEATLEDTDQSSPLLSFDIPGLVAMNHPDRNPNGASAEFFCIQNDSMLDEKRQLLDGQYAPFGYVVEGLDVYQSLKAGDVIDATYCDEWGSLSLVKRRSSFYEVVQGGES